MRSWEQGSGGVRRSHLWVSLTVRGQGAEKQHSVPGKTEQRERFETRRVKECLCTDGSGSFLS